MGIGLLDRRKPDVPRFLDPELLSRVPVQPVPSYDQMPSLNSGLLTRPVSVPSPNLNPSVVDTTDMGPAPNGLLTRNPIALPDSVYSNPTPTAVDTSAMGGAPAMVLRRDGRPTDQVIGGESNLDRILARRDALENYQPQRESKKMMAVRGLLAFLGGGIPGAVSTVAGDAIDRRGLDRNWRDRQLGQVQQQIGGELLTRKAADESLNDQSTRNYRDAQSQELLSRASRPPKADSKFIERGDGVYEVSTEFPEGRKVGNIPAEAKSKNANPTRYFERPDGVYGINDEHPDGFKVAGVPGMPDKTTDALARENERAGQENSAIERSIQAARNEQARMGPSPPTTITRVDPGTITTETPNGIPQQVTNPAYTEWATRFRQLDDEIRRLGVQKKPIVSTAPRGTGGFKPARDGKFHYTPEQIRQSLKQGQSYDEVYRQLKARPNVMIDEN